MGQQQEIKSMFLVKTNLGKKVLFRRLGHKYQELLRGEARKEHETQSCCLI